MRNKLIAGNWKMNKDIHESANLIDELKQKVTTNEKVGVLLCLPSISLVIANTLLKDSSMKLGAQNMSDKDDGAFTGEISARMLKSVGCTAVILGHSERRQYFKETNEYINLKAKKALASQLVPIICVGETLQERESGITDAVITAQIKGVLAGLSASEMEDVVIAYEPVWAIGTGKTATTEQANAVHKLIRKLVGQMFSWAIAEQLIIQYGGSVNEKNALELLSQSDIDGALVGGASLKADSFAAIVKAGCEAIGK
ncbi:MAG: triose-phosphate isomerase [Ignavibacteria bacterium]|nr:triose-phosphate isomerase [Ignavibacteria bacterium]